MRTPERPIEWFGSVVVLIGLIVFVAFVVNNGSLPVGPAVGGSVTVNSIDVSQNGTVTATNVDELNFIQGTVVASGSSAQITFATPTPVAGGGGGFSKSQGLAIHDAATPTSSDVSGIPNVKIGGSGSFFPSAADTYYEPFYVEREININRISLERTDANPAQDCSVGIYNADEQWQPTTLEVDFSPLTLAGGGAAWNHKTVNYNLPAGSYLSAYLCNGAPLGVFLGETDISFAIENTTGFAVVFTRWNVDVPSISPATPFPATGDTWDDYLLQGTADNTFWSLVYRYTVN